MRSFRQLCLPSLAAGLCREGGWCSRVGPAAWRGLSSSASQCASFDYQYDNPEHTDGDPAAEKATDGLNTAEAALKRGVASSIIEFQIPVDDAIRRFNTHQASSCKGMHSHNLISRKQSTTVKSAYLPVWCFTCKITAEYKGILGFKDAKVGEMAWKDMEDWQTLCHKKEISWESDPGLQVYASYNYERILGGAAVIPDASCLSAARPFTQDEAAALRAAAGQATAASTILTDSQRGDALPQQPQSRPPSRASQPYQQASQAQAGADPADVQGGHQSSKVVVHPPDMQQATAWQLAYRALMHELTQTASQAAMKSSGAVDVKDMHVVIQVHHLTASLMYLPVYVAHYQAGERIKQGTSTVIKPQMFYAAISGLAQGRLVAATHVSPRKMQAAAGSLVGALGLTAGTATWTGLEPLLALGPAESLTLAVISAALAGMWAAGLPQAERNKLTAAQVKAEREFFRQYDARETKTASALAAAVAAAEAGGKAPQPLEAGELADDYMQWLWMDNDWRRWECDEPWNWDPVKQQQAAEQIALRNVLRRKERQQYLERLLEDRRKREHEMEQELLRSQRTGRAPGSRRGFDPSAHGVSPGAEYARKRRDFLGYYRMLNLADAEDITVEMIKAAFKGQAMQLHPDKVVAGGGSEAAVKDAHVHFQRLQMAYDVLRDPEKRRAYDRGQLVQ